MNDFSSVSDSEEVTPVPRKKWQWLLLLIILGVAAFLIFVVVRNIKPVSLQNQATLAAPLITLNWQLTDPDNTVSSRIYRTTDKFLTEPVASNLIATVAAPATTYQDSNVTMGTVYYYSIFEVDSRGQTFDPSYYSVKPTDTDPTPAPQQQTGPAPTAAVSIKDLTNFKCGDGPAVYVYYKGHKEVYPEAAVFLSWNNSWDGIVTLSVEECGKISGDSWVRLPDSALVKVPGNATVWHIEGPDARPIATLAALNRISAQPKITTVSAGYLKLYNSGAVIQ